MAALAAPFYELLPKPRPLRAAPRLGPQLALSALLVAWSSLAGTARAQDAPSPPEPQGPSKAECAASFEQSQRLRNASSYLEASKEALTCANQACGSVLATECSRLYDELRTATPSVVFGARDERGNELTGVRVQIDADTTLRPLDGKAVALDPGSHEFRFLAEGSPPTHQVAVIRTGEQLRSVIGVMRKAPPRVAESAKRPAAVVTTAEPRTLPLASYVAGGVALAGFAGFVAFRIAGARDYDALANGCKPNCTADEVDGARRKYLFSNIGLALGGAATAAAVTFYFSAPRAQGKATALQMVPTGDGVAARLTTLF